MNTKDFLVGKTINSIYITEDKRALLFRCSDGDHKVFVGAECCSHSWIEHIELPAGGFPCSVSRVRDVDLERQELNRDPFDDNVLQKYGLTIVTDKGLIEIDYRNESNGYYGGSIIWPGDYEYDYFCKDTINAEEWREV